MKSFLLCLQQIVWVDAITVGYWSIRGLAAPLRAMVMYADVPLNNVMYDCTENEDGSFDRSAWASVKPELKEKNPLMNLPYVIADGKIVTQSNACLSFLGRKLGLWGKTDDEICDCEQLLCEVMDLRNMMIRFAYGSGNSDPAAAAKFITNVQAPNDTLSKLELWLERKATNHNGNFLVGNSATAPDFHLYEMLVQYTAISEYHSLPCVLSIFPRLSHFKEHFEKLPKMKRYLSTPMGSITPRQLPFNNKTASFGADPTGSAWITGKKYDYHTHCGIY